MTKREEHKVDEVRLTLIQSNNVNGVLVLVNESLMEEVENPSFFTDIGMELDKEVNNND